MAAAPDSSGEGRKGKPERQKLERKGRSQVLGSYKKDPKASITLAWLADGKRARDNADTE